MHKITKSQDWELKKRQRDFPNSARDTAIAHESRIKKSNYIRQRTKELRKQLIQDFVAKTAEEIKNLSELELIDYRIKAELSNGFVPCGDNPIIDEYDGVTNDYVIASGDQHDPVVTNEKNKRKIEEMLGTTFSTFEEAQQALFANDLRSRIALAASEQEVKQKTKQPDDSYNPYNFSIRDSMFNS